MSTLRFRSRHLHLTLFNTIKDELTALGWAGPDVPLGTTAVQFMEVQPEQEGVDFQPNLVAVSIGDSGTRKPIEVGDGLFAYPVPVFVDVYGEKRGISTSICEDVMDILRTYQDTSYIMDYTNVNSPVASEDTWYVDSSEGPMMPVAAEEATDFRKYWRVCRFLVIVEYLQ